MIKMFGSLTKHKGEYIYFFKSQMVVVSVWNSGFAAVHMSSSSYLQFQTAIHEENILLNKNKKTKKSIYSLKRDWLSPFWFRSDDPHSTAYDAQQTKFTSNSLCLTNNKLFETFDLSSIEMPCGCAVSALPSVPFRPTVSFFSLLNSVGSLSPRSLQFDRC